MIRLDTPMTEHSLKTVSDTALWVAHYRAMESERPDAIFRDPYAARLAGDRGRQIVETMRVASMAWPMIVRTAVMDEIILRLIGSEGVDCVWNLAAGLDARPYRLPLPAGLKWVETDLPPMLAYKTEKLAGETPRCRFESAPADLTDAPARRALFSRAAEGTRCILTVTEGLLGYLTEDQVASLARDLHEPPASQFWLIDLASPRLLRMLQRRYGKHLNAANAPFRFAPEAGTKFFEPFGWREREFRSTWEEGRRLHRRMKLAWLFDLLGRMQSPARREETRRMGGIVLLERIPEKREA